MRRISFCVLVLLTSVAAASCGSNSTSPSSPTSTSGGSGGGSGGSGPTGQTAVSTDKTFDDNDWETQVFPSGDGGTGSAGHLTYLGQVGGDYRQVTITPNGANGSVAVFSIYIASGAQYFPSSSGAIFSVDYSEDSILFSGGGNGQYSAPAIRQNGKYYTLVPGGKAFATPDANWTHHALSGLTQSDFRTLASASDHPDFSASGSRIEVGFMRIVPTGNSGAKVVGGIDNWQLTLNR